MAVPDEGDVAEADVVFLPLFDVGLEDLALTQIDRAQGTGILDVVHLDFQKTVVIELSWVGKDTPNGILHSVKIEDVTDED